MNCVCGHPIYWKPKKKMWGHGGIEGGVRCTWVGCNCVKPIPDYDYIICPKCHSLKYRTDGFRRNKKGCKQRYKCLSCGYRYTHKKKDKIPSNIMNQGDLL